MPTERDKSPLLKLNNRSESPANSKFWNRSEKRKCLAMMFVGCAMLYSTRVALPMCSVAVSKEVGWDKRQAGAVLSAFFWGYTMTQCIGGYLSDRIGGELVLAAAALVWAAATTITPFIIHTFHGTEAGIAVPVILRIILGCAQGMHFPSISSVLARNLPTEEKAFGLAFSMSGNKLGTIMTGSAGSLVITHLGWPILFYILGALSLLWSLSVKYIMVPQLGDKAIPADSSTTKSEPIPWVILFKHPAIWALLFSHFCMTSAFFVLLSWMPTYFEETFPDAERWVYNVVPWIICIPTSILGGKFTDGLVSRGWSVNLVRKGIQTCSFLGFAVCLALISFLGTYEAALICMTCAMGFETLHASGICINPQDIAPKFSGFVFGMMNTAGAIPGFVGTYIAGYILETTGSWSTVFNLASVMLVMGWVTFTMFGTTKRIV